MPAFVPGFDFDVFVSYAHVDNLELVAGNESSRWVHTLVDSLKVFLFKKLGRKDWGTVWLDRRLAGNEPFPPEIRQAVCRSATLLVILSEGYLNSEWCRQERELFLQAATRQGGAQGRIFVVHETEIDRARCPESFKDLLGYRFFKKDREDAPARTLGVPIPDPKTDRAYFERLDDLSWELTKRLQAMQTAPKTPGTPALPVDSPITVFLAEATVDLEDLRDNLKRHLEQVGLRVLPETYYDRSPPAFAEAMEKDLAESALFVQLLGRYRSPKTRDLPKGYEGLQLDLAKAAGKPIMRWHDPVLDVQTVKDPGLLAGEDVMVMAFEDFKREVERQARLTVVAARNHAPISGAFALINADKLDQSVALDFCKALDQYAIGYDIVDESTPLSDLAQDEEYDALIVIYGQCEQAWVQNQVRQCRKVMLYKKSRPPVCAVYTGPPPAKEPLRIKPPLFHFFTAPDEPVFGKFIEAVKARLAGQ